MNWRVPAYQMQKLKKSSLIIPVLVGIISVVLCSVVGINCVSLKNRQKQYKEQINKYQALLEKEQERTEEIKEYALYTKTTAYYEEVAREKYRLVHDNEILFVND